MIMDSLRMISWNVNGIRAVEKKQALKWIDGEKVDILSLQETKCSIAQIPLETIFNRNFKEQITSESQIPGRSGTVSFTDLPINYQDTCPRVDVLNEGRINELHFGFDGKEIVFFNVYFPNGQSKEERLNYKMEFYDRFLTYCEELRMMGKSIIVCGDVNTAHKEIDLTNPKQNAKVSGFLPMEREWIDKFLLQGYIDTFRHIRGQVENSYTWWSYRTNAREKNIGWRIDYFFVSEDLKDNIHLVDILSDVLGSDHCPIVLELKPTQK
jgi:exodeoxyribonuclease-3